MTSLIQDSSFDPEFKQLLLKLSARITASLVCEITPIALRSGVRDAVNLALFDIARSGQRDPAQLERYARARGVAFIMKSAEAKTTSEKHSS